MVNTICSESSVLAYQYDHELWPLWMWKSYVLIYSGLNVFIFVVHWSLELDFLGYIKALIFSQSGISYLYCLTDFTFLFFFFSQTSHFNQVTDKFNGDFTTTL